MEKLLNLIQKRNRNQQNLFQIPEINTSQDICPFCGSMALIHDNVQGHVVCSDCSRIISARVVSEGQEWREFQDDEKSKSRARASGPINQLTEGMIAETRIRGTGRSASVLRRAENAVSSRNKDNMRLQKRFQEISQLCSLLRLPPYIQEAAKHMFKDYAFERSRRKSRHMDGICVGIYLACRQHKIDIKPDKLLEKAKADKKGFTKVLKEVQKDLRNKQKVATPKETAREFGEKLHMEEEHIRKAERIAEKAIEYRLLEGSKPKDVAATAIWMSLKSANLLNDEYENRLEKFSSTDRQTLSNHYRILISYKSQLLA